MPARVTRARVEDPITLASIHAAIEHLQKNNCPEPYIWGAHPDVSDTLKALLPLSLFCPWVQFDPEDRPSRDALLMGYPVVWNDILFSGVLCLRGKDDPPFGHLVPPQYDPAIIAMLHPHEILTGQPYVASSDPIDSMDDYELRVEVRRIRARLSEAAISF